MKKKTDNVQVNIAIPREWKEQLDALARIYSVEEERTVTFQELMRRAIGEKLQLEAGETDEQS